MAEADRGEPDFDIEMSAQRTGNGRASSSKASAVLQLQSEFGIPNVDVGCWISREASQRYELSLRVTRPDLGMMRVGKAELFWFS